MRRAKLLDLANLEKLPMTVRSDDSFTISRGSIRVRFYPDGSILRDDVRLDLARSMTVKEAAKCLRLAAL